MMKSIGTRTLSVLLAACLLLGCLTLPALAEETPPAASWTLTEEDVAGRDDVKRLVFSAASSLDLQTATVTLSCDTDAVSLVWAYDLTDAGNPTAAVTQALLTDNGHLAPSLTPMRLVRDSENHRLSFTCGVNTTSGIHLEGLTPVFAVYYRIKDPAKMAKGTWRVVTDPDLLNAVWGDDTGAGVVFSYGNLSGDTNTFLAYGPGRTCVTGGGKTVLPMERGALTYTGSDIPVLQSFHMALVPPTLTVTREPQTVIPVLSNALDTEGDPFALADVVYSIETDTHPGITLAADGKVTVDKTAQTGHYTLKAALGGVERSMDLYVIRPDAVPTLITIEAQPSAVISKPGSGRPDATATFTAQVLDQLDGEMPGAAVVWTNSCTLSGVTVTDNVVSVSSSAATGSFTLTATAAADPAVTASVTVRVVNLQFRVGEGAITVVDAPTYGMTWEDMIRITPSKISATVGLDIIYGGSYTVADARLIPDAGEQTYTVLFTGDGYTNVPVVSDVPITVLPKALSLASVEGEDRIYNGSAAVALSGAALSGVLPADQGKVSADLAGITGTISSPNAGTYDRVTLSAAPGLTGDRAFNYTLTPPSGPVAASVTVSPKPLSHSDITASAQNTVYTGSAAAPQVTVTDGSTPLTAGRDYTTRCTAVDAGTALVMVSGMGNYGGSLPVSFTISPKPLSGTVTLSGTPKVGQSLTAACSDPDADVTWAWGTLQEGRFTPFPGVSGSVYRITADCVGLTLCAQASGQGNYTGTLRSQGVVIPKIALAGALAIAVDHAGGSDPLRIDAGDVLSADCSALNTAEGTCAWTVGGVSAGSAPTYTVQTADLGKVVTLTFTATGSRYEGSLSTQAEVGKALLTGSVTIAPDESGKTITALLTDTPGDEHYDPVWLRDGVPVEGAHSLTYTVTSADRCHDISLRLTAKGELYTGQLVSNVLSIPAAVPETPVMTAAAASGKVTLSWTAPGDNGSPILSYTLTSLDTDETIELPPSALSYTFTGLKNGTAYRFTLSAANALGSGAPCAPVTATPKGSTGGYTPAPSPSRPDPTPDPEPEPEPDPGLPPALRIIEDEDTGALTAVLPGETDKEGNVSIRLTEDQAKALMAAVKAAPEGSDLTLHTDVPWTAGSIAVTLPADAVAAAAEGPADRILLDTLAADLALDRFALAALSAVQKEVTLTAARNMDGTLTFSVAADGAPVAALSGLTAYLPAGEDAGSGTVAVRRNADGTWSIIRTSVVVDGILITPLEGSCTVKLIDNAKAFGDIAGHWAAGNIDFVSARELFNGTAEGVFSPDMAMSRGMLATVLFRLDGEHKADVAAAFTDLQEGSWYVDAVAWAAQQGIVKGYSPEFFGPDLDITREQLAAMIYRYAQAQGLGFRDEWRYPLSYVDVDDISDWAYEPVAWLTLHGILTGRPGAIIDPQGKATRAEVAAVLERYVRMAAH